MKIVTRPVNKKVAALWVATGVSRPLARVYAARGLESLADVEYSAVRSYQPDQMLGMAKAVEILQEALSKQSAITIVGDYDCDGATATAVMVRGLRSFGAKRVNFLVPNRFTDGYGLTPSIVDKVRMQYPETQVLITVDNGISSIDGVAAAKAAGFQVIVTDHHLPGDHLPDADVILDPNQPGCQFPTSTAGVGVAFYLILGLYRSLKESQHQVDYPNPTQFTPLVALGTVADVVPLEFNNRLLVANGLNRWKSGKAPEGLLALARVSKCSLEHLASSHLAFQIGPRLNAAGRMDDMTVGIRCLLTESPEEALELANQLETFNKERRKKEGDQLQMALDNLEISPSGKFGMSVCLSSGHLGVIGIVAGRLREQFHRPTIVFATDGPVLKGSARSIPGFHIRDALADLATHHPEWFKGFGGHAMAAGLTLSSPEYLEEFSTAFDAIAKERISPEMFAETLMTDGPLFPGEISLDLAETLSSGVWGQAFPEPLFENEFSVQSAKSTKTGHLSMELVGSGGEIFQAIYFRPSVTADTGDRIRAVYALDVQRWGKFQNDPAVQLRIQWMEVLVPDDRSSDLQ